MNPSPLGSSEAILALCLALLLLAPLAIAGVALINTGLNRSRSAAQALLGNLTVISVTAIAFALLGATFCGSLPGGAGHIFSLAGKPWNYFGAGPFFLGGMASAPVLSQLALIFEFLTRVSFF